MQRTTRSQAGGALAGVLALLLLLTAGIAVAANPVKGGSYKGTLAKPPGFSITFKVSSDGKRVTQLKLSNAPFYCSGGGPVTPVKFKNATVKKGAFKSKSSAKITVGPNKGKPRYDMTLTGKFAKGRKASGNLTADWFGKDKSCDGKTTFSAKA